MALSWINHIWQLYQCVVSKLIGMVRALRTIFSSACNKYFSIIRLNTAESDRNRKFLQQLFTCLSVIVNVIVSNNLLVKFKKVNSIIAIP